MLGIIGKRDDVGTNRKEKDETQPTNGEAALGRGPARGASGETSEMGCLPLRGEPGTHGG